MSAKSAVDIIGVRVDQLSVNGGLEQITIHLRDGTSSICVIKPYVKFFVLASRDEALRRQLNSADLSLADGISVQWAASFLYGRPKPKPNLLNLSRSLLVWIHRPGWISQIIPERGAGVDATTKLLQRAELTGWRVGIVSGPAKQTEMIRQNVLTRFRDLDFLRVWPGFFEPGSPEEVEIISQIKQAKLDILLVGRGFPLQEEFITTHKNGALAKVLIAEGGTFDYDQLGGTVKRAPQTWRRIGLEWLWRALSQPQKFSNLLLVLKFINLVYRQAKKQK